MDAPEIHPTPNCPNCNGGNTWGKHKLTREYDHPKANSFCKNCRCEFYAPPNWFMQDNYEQEMKVFK